MQTLYLGTGYNSCNNRFRAVDYAGNTSEWTSIYHIHMDTEVPVHTNWWWGEVNANVARLYIQATDSASGIARVTATTSTQSGEYGNWHNFEAVWDAEANAYRADINPATFGHYGQTYLTHLYIWDNAGNGGYMNATNVNIPSNEVSLYNRGYINTELTGGFDRYFHDPYYMGGVYKFEADHFYSGEIDKSGYNSCCIRSNSAIDFTDYRYMRVVASLTNVSVTSGYDCNGSIILSPDSNFTHAGRGGGSQNISLWWDVINKKESSDIYNVYATIDISGITGYHYLYARAFSGAWSPDTALFRVYEITLIK